LEFNRDLVGVRELESLGYRAALLCDDICFDRTPICVRRTDGWTHGFSLYIYHVSIASRGRTNEKETKKCYSNSLSLSLDAYCRTIHQQVTIFNQKSCSRCKPTTDVRCQLPKNVCRSMRTGIFRAIWK